MMRFLSAPHIVDLCHRLPHRLAGCARCGLIIWLGIGCLTNGAPLIAQDVAATRRMSERVDELLEAHLQELGWQASGPASDAAFFRRSYLDLTGLPPTGGEVMRFLNDSSPQKREELIDRLLASPTCASHLADTWSRWMLPEDNNNPFLQPGQQGLQNWLRDRFAENLRYDRLVSDLLVASGPAQSGPTQFFVALEGKPEKIAAKTARVFMGVQLDCAECHDHPFDNWSQQDFWGFAAYFARLSAGNGSPMAAQGVTDLEEGEVTLPDSEEVVQPKPLVKTGFSGISRGTRRQQLTLWLTARENPFLARATVNRVWAMLFGQGLIEPIDDMRSLEMASHPELLGELSDYFASTGYDLRNLLEMLTKTRAYGRSTTHISGPPPANSYAVMATKPLTEQQLSQSLAVIARQIAGQDPARTAALTTQLGRLRGDASEAKLGIVSALVTLHGDAFDAVTQPESSRLLKALEAPYLDRRKQLRWLFLSTLNRPPTPAEEAAFSDTLGAPVDESSVAATDAPAEDPSAKNDQAADQQNAWQSDLLWALINSTEFAMTP